MHSIHYEEIFGKKPEVVKFLQLQTLEIKNANYKVTRTSRRASVAMPVGVDLILKKKNNMKFNGFYLIYDEEME